MSQPAGLDLDALSHTELKALVIQLLGTVAELKQIIVQQREEIGELRDEIARLKGLPPRPPAAKAKPSGMERATTPETSGKMRSRRRRGAKRDKLTVTREVVLKPEVPAGSRFKGYEDILVQDLCIRAEVIRYRRERWLTAEGRTIVAALPPGISGGYGPELQRVILGLHTQGQVTSERLEAILTGAGIAISKRQVLRLIGRQMTTFEPEDQAVLRAGLATARWITVDGPLGNAGGGTPARNWPARPALSPRSATIASPSSGRERPSRANASCPCCGPAIPTTASAPRPSPICAPTT